MILYLLLPFTILLWKRFYTNRGKCDNNKLFITLLIQFVFIFGFRHAFILDEYSIIWDSELTENIGTFYEVSDIRLEKGYLIYQKFLHNVISQNYVIFFFTTICLTVGFTIFFFYKKSRDFATSLFLYVTTCTMFLYIDAVRQALAFSILLLAVLFIEKKTTISVLCAVGLVFLATTFHKTAIVGGVVLPLYFLKPSKRNFVFFIIAATFFVVYLEDIISMIGEGDSRYLEDDNAKLGNMLYIAFYIMMLIVSKKTNNEIFQRDRVLFWGAYLTVLCYILSLFITVLNRTASYFCIYNILLFSNCLYDNPKAKPLKIWIMIGAYLMFFIILYYRPEWYHTRDFAFFWQDYVKGTNY